MLARRADEVISRYFKEAQRSPARKRGRDLGYELLTQGTRPETRTGSMPKHDVLDPRAHIETPENVRLTYHLAGPGSRAGAYLLDLVLRWFILGGLMMFVATAMPLMGISGLPIGIWLVGLFVVEWGYGCLFEGLMERTDTRQARFSPSSGENGRLPHRFL